MRTAFLQSLVALAESNANLWLITGDLGYSVLEPFRDRFPDRFVNVGVAEQNMIGVAAGLALAGKTVVTYSIVNFPVMRALEQIRNDVAYHNLPVTIVTVGGGLVYGAHGYTHHGAEDLGVMRLMPNVSIMCPADPVEATWGIRQLVVKGGPGYLRLARGGEPTVHEKPLDNQEIDLPIRLRSGRHFTIAACGPIVGLALTIQEVFAARGLPGTVFSVPALTPLNSETIWQAAEQSGRLLVLEDHGRGGLATILSEELSAQSRNVRMQILNYQREPVKVAGRFEFLRARHGISYDAVQAILDEWLAE